MIALDKTLVQQVRRRVVDQRGAAANHDAVMYGRKRSKACIAEQFSRSHQVGDAAAIAERVARHGRIIDQLVAYEVADQIVLRQFFGDHLAIGEFGDAAAAVQQHDFLEALVGLGVLDYAEEWREPGAGANRYRLRPSSRLSISSVPVAFRLTMISSPFLSC